MTQDDLRFEEKQGDEHDAMGRRGFLSVGALAAGGVGVSGVSRTRDGNDAFIGEIIMVPYNFAPRNFVFCEGQTLPISNYQSLFSLIGTYFGGDGRSTFQLPDTRRLEATLTRSMSGSRPPFRYVIAVNGTYPSRS